MRYLVLINDYHVECITCNLYIYQRMLQLNSVRGHIEDVKRQQITIEEEELSVHHRRLASKL